MMAKIPKQRGSGQTGGSMFNAVNRATKAAADVVAAAGGGGGKKGCLILTPTTFGALAGASWAVERLL